MISCYKLQSLATITALINGKKKYASELDLKSVLLKTSGSQVILNVAGSLPHHLLCTALIVYLLQLLNKSVIIKVFIIILFMLYLWILSRCD